MVGRMLVIILYHCLTFFHYFIILYIATLFVEIKKFAYVVRFLLNNMAFILPNLTFYLLYTYQIFMQIRLKFEVRKYSCLLGCSDSGFSVILA